MSERAVSAEPACLGAQKFDRSLDPKTSIGSHCSSLNTSLAGVGGANDLFVLCLLDHHLLLLLYAFLLSLN